LTPAFKQTKTQARVAGVLAADFLRRIPVWMIEAEQPALRGAAMALGVCVAG